MAFAALLSASTALTGTTSLLGTRTRGMAVHMEAPGGLEELAKEQNPILGYFDPLNLASWDYFSMGDDAMVGFLRHAEIKHGRVAMAGFLGYCVQSNLPGGLPIVKPFDAQIAAGLTPPAQWDALSEPAKWQILLFIGFLEIYSEHSFILEKQGEKHYMKGGKPGYYPKFDSLPHPVPFNLYNPFGQFPAMSDELRAKRLNIEVNNGRLAMIGLFSLISEASVPGSVPALSGVVPPYAGNVMAPFAADFSFF